MIIRPSQKSLADSVRDLEGSEYFSFLIAPTSVRYLGENVDIKHILMIGPIRWPTHGTGRGNDYKGSYWDSTIYVYPKSKLGNLDYAAEYFQDELLGHPSRRKRQVPRWIPLRYDFGPEAQPERDDGVKKIPHVITFLIESPEEGPRLAKEKKGYLEWKALGDMRERILIPPPPHMHWEDVPAVQAKAEEVIRKGKVKHSR